MLMAYDGIEKMRWINGGEESFLAEKETLWCGVVLWIAPSFFMRNLAITTSN